MPPGEVCPGTAPTLRPSRAGSVHPGMERVLCGLRLPARHPRGLYALCAVGYASASPLHCSGSLLLLYLSERLRLSLGSATRWGGAFNAGLPVVGDRA